MTGVAAAVALMIRPLPSAIQSKPSLPVSIPLPLIPVIAVASAVASGSAGSKLTS